MIESIDWTKPVDPADVNRRPLNLDNELEYVLGAVVLNPDTYRFSQAPPREQVAEKYRAVQLLMYDILAFEHIWEEPLDRLLVLRKHRGIDFELWKPKLAGNVRPYTTVLMLASEFEETLQAARAQTLRLVYNDGRERYSAPVYANTLLFGPLPSDFPGGLRQIPASARIELTEKLRPDFLQKANDIKGFFRGVVQDILTQGALDNPDRGEKQ